MKKRMKALLGILLILAGVGLAGWLGVYVMLYGGIVGAIHAWGVDTSAAVWNIIRAVFWEVGVFAGIVVGAVGAALLGWKK